MKKSSTKHQSECFARSVFYEQLFCILLKRLFVYVFSYANDPALQSLEFNDFPSSELGKG